MLLSKFITYLKYERRCSEYTLRAYINDIKKFSEFASGNFALFSLSTVDDKMIRRWIVYLRERNYKPASINRKISSLKRMYKFAKLRGYVQVNPVDKIIFQKKAKRIPSFLSEAEIQKLFDFSQQFFTDDIVGRKELLICELFYNSGMRLSELVNLRVSDVDFVKNAIKVHGKRDKQRVIPLMPSLICKINSYINESGSENLSSLEDVYIFKNDKGCKLYPAFVYRIVNKYLSLVTTVAQRSPHTLRHSFATHLLNNGADINIIKELLGHASLTSTEVYTHNSFERLKQVYKQAHPRA